jgi:hypothetical protein
LLTPEQRLTNQVRIDEASRSAGQPAEGEVRFGQQTDGRSAQGQFARHRVGHEGDNAVDKWQESARAIRFERRGLHDILASYRSTVAILPSGV